MLAMLAFTTLSFTACNNDKDDEPVNEDVILATPNYADDAIRLKFDDPVKYDDEFNLTELELTESGYYLLKLEKANPFAVKATRLSVRTYKFLNDLFSKAENVYNLKNFGTVKITSNGSKYTVELTFNGNTITVTASKNGITISDSSRTTLNLCRTWTIQSTRVQIEGESGFYQEAGCDLNSILAYVQQHAQISDEVQSNQVISRISFSNNGTFTLVYANGLTDRAQWQWVSPANGTLTYTWEHNDMGYSFINGQASVQIHQKGTPSRLLLSGTVKNNKGENKNITVTVNMI